MNYKSNRKRIQYILAMLQHDMLSTVRDSRQSMASFSTDPEIYRALKKALLSPPTRGGR